MRKGQLLLLLLLLLIDEGNCDCGFPGAPAHSTVRFSTSSASGVSTTWGVGTIARYECDRGFELLGPARRICTRNATWNPQGIPFCVLNVAAGKAPMQSSVSGSGIPQRAVDGKTSSSFNEDTCSNTEPEMAPWWYVNLLEPYMVQLVRVDFGQSCCAEGKKATIVVRVGNNRPDLGVNPVCNRFTGSLEEGRPLFLPCNPPMPGAFVSVAFEGPVGVQLSICEAFVYTDQALPIERCPSFRDQPPGSTATYNGKCYIFYNRQPQNFQKAMEFCAQRGGSLVDQSNPALQGFLSWELWRRHKGDASGQYWLGAVRDRNDAKTWKWINGKPVTVSFWNLPGGNENCARFDGTKGWLWADTNCALDLNFICQHRPSTCGKPEQPPNSTLVISASATIGRGARKTFRVGSKVQYVCDEGHLLVGPATRTCLPTGFYSEFPPVCRFLECGPAAEIAFGRLLLLNNSRHFGSVIRYECEPGFVLVGKADLMCDVDQKWNGPPPRCDPVYCQEPTPIRHGGVHLSTNSTRFGTVATYFCASRQHELRGSASIRCRADGSWDARPPICVDANNENKDNNNNNGNNSDNDDKNDDKEERNEESSVGGVPPSLIASPTNRITTGGRFGDSEDEDIANNGNSNRRILDDGRRYDRPVSGVSQTRSGQRTNEPLSNDEEPAKKARLNLGGIIALGVFGGFVLLAAIITTIVILIRSGHSLRSWSHFFAPSDPDLALNSEHEASKRRWYTLLALPDQEIRNPSCSNL